MKLIFRNFLFILKRFRTSSILNIIGLSVAFAVFYIIVVQAYYDFGYNRNLEKADDIHLFSWYHPKSNLRNGKITSYWLEQLIKDPGVKNYCVVIEETVRQYDIHDTTGNIRTFSETTTCIGEGNSFIEMFTPEIIVGDTSQTFAPGKAMITESTAKKIFGDENPIGEVCFFHDSNNPITVAAICKDFPDNCDFKNGVYISEERNIWEQYPAYVELFPGVGKKITDTLNSMVPGDWFTELTPISDVHLKLPIQGKGNFETTVSLMAIGILLIIIAYINFVNFTVAMAPVRMRSLNIRRIMGERISMLRFSLITEAVFLSFLAFLLSLFFVYGLNGGVIKEFFLADLSLTKNRELLLSIAGSSLVMGFLAGIYPAFYSTAFNPAFVIKISSAVSYSNKRLRDTLITVQFIGVIFLVITASFIKVQHKYMQDKSWGINKENVVYLSVRQILPTISDFENEIKKNPDIFDVTYASSLPGNDNMWTWGVSFKEISNLDLRMFAIKSNFLRFFGIDVIEGRDFKEEDDPDIAKIIFNRTLVNRYNLEDAIGEKFPNPKTGGTSEIIGIAKDFNYQSLKEFIRPVGFMTGESISYLLSYMFLKVNGQNTSKTIDYVRNVWKTFSNEPVDVIFLDETLRQLYKQEENLAKLLSIFSLITIIVAVMGVYGLILFNAKSKRKTIALHKINGASITDVILMLNRGFLMQFAVAYVIAVPVAYYTVNRWLENFVYKTPVHWWMFVAGGLLVFLITAATVSWQSYKAATANPVEALKGE